MSVRSLVSGAKSRAVRWTFNSAVVRALCERMTRRCPRILMYHRFAGAHEDRKLPQQEFARQMKFLRDQNFNVMPLPLLAERLAHDEPPPRTVAVTVDDGYEDFHRYAMPVLREYRIPATIFVTNDFIDQTLWLWPDVVEYAIMSTRKPALAHSRSGEERVYALGSPAERRKVWSTVGDHLLSMGDRDRTDAIRALCEQLDVSVPSRPPEEFRAMSWEQARQCHEAGVEIGGHTMKHPILTSMPEAEAEAEITRSKQDIEVRIGAPCKSFAYPNGTTADYNDAIKAMVARAGFTNASVAFHDGQRSFDLMELRRFSMGPNFERFTRALSGAEQVSLAIKSRLNVR
jgi:peptidoglycan/xylan/chitin deacetylase (PgdA/CDA1 family)